MTKSTNTPRLDLNPSSSERWTTCTASPHFLLENWDKLPPSGSKFSEEGTTAHEVAAAMVLGREPNEAQCPTPIDGEMRMHAWDYMEYVNGLREKGSTITVETKYPLWYMPERNALVDVAIINPGNAHIVDLKYGEGIIVSPVENIQGAIYARSVLPRLWKKHVGDAFPVTIHIYQPRGRDMTQPHHTWETTWGELVAFTSERVEKPAQRILVHGRSPQTLSALEFAPSDKACQWCPAKGFCSARQAALTGDFGDLTVLEPKALAFPDTLSEEQRVAVQTHGAEIKKWIDDVQEYNTERMKAGHPLPGFKLVLSRGGNRYWTDPKKAAALLLETTVLRKDEVIEEKVIGPAAVEKKLGKNKMNVDLVNLIDKPPGSPVIALFEDKGEAIAAVSAAEEFQPLE